MIQSVQDCNYMNINKKIAICSSCRFFPTKADQNSVNALQIKDQSITWKCKACKHRNLISKSQLIMLPQTNYLKLPLNMVLNNQNTLKNYHYLIAIHYNQKEEVAYSDLENIHLVQQQLKVDLSFIENVEKLESKSNWFKEYRKKKQALQKFEEIKKKQNRFIFKDQYIIYLLHQFLKSEFYKISLKDEMYTIEVDIVLKYKQKLFSFNLQSIELEQNNASLSNFILIYLLTKMNFLPSWTSKLYSKQIKNHQCFCGLRNKYSSLLVLNSCVNQQYQILMKQFPDSELINTIEQSFNNKLERLLLNEHMFEKFRVYPLSSHSFIKYLQTKKQNEKSSREYIDIFCRQRRSSQIEKYTLTDDLQDLKSILLSSKGYSLDIEESELKKLILEQLKGLRGNTFAKLIKLIANFDSNGSRMVALYTFDWSKILIKEIYQSLEEPAQYQDVLKEDVLSNFTQKKKAFNPFSKKKKIQNVEQINKQQAAKQNDDYISF